MAYAPISLLLHANVGPRCATSEPLPKWQPLRPPAGAEMPAGDIIGCSGQMPVSIMPMTTFEPAWPEPPSAGHTLVAPMKLVLSSSGWLSASLCTATTPGCASSLPILFAGTRAAMPPYATVSSWPIFALGTARLMPAVIRVAFVIRERLVARERLDVLRSALCVTRGLVALRPLIPPA